MASSHFIPSDKIGFFFGAGASVEFGVPTMKQMTEEYAEQISKDVSISRQLFFQIFKSSQDAYGKKNVDIEAIMSIIAGLKEREHLRENIGDLAAFYLKQEGMRYVQEEFKKYDKGRLSCLEETIKESIREKVLLTTEGIDQVREAYNDFFKQLSTITNSSEGEESNPYKYSAHKWVFFTTNYDNVIEEYWVKFRKYPILDLGFDPSTRIMNADKFVERHLSNVNSSMQLVKLHGSVNWIKNKEGDIQEHPFGSNYGSVSSRSGTGDIVDEIMIYPLSQKQLYFTPYIQLFRILEADLEKRDFWIVIGYSFRDIIIRTMFEKALLRQKNNRKILLVHSNPIKVIKLFLEETRNQIVPLKAYFGRKKDFADVNKNIIDALGTTG
jgi:hypothetical protein